ncbi:hypothetical protein TNCV_305551 [Trichonephila clavipes]|nr:hypothetical protein TNCV_305551 [Trichonephila clavipes]
MDGSAHRTSARRICTSGTINALAERDVYIHRTTQSGTDEELSRTPSDIERQTQLCHRMLSSCGTLNPPFFNIQQEYLASRKRKSVGKFVPFCYGTYTGGFATRPTHLQGVYREDLKFHRNAVVAKRKRIDTPTREWKRLD